MSRRLERDEAEFGTLGSITVTLAVMDGHDTPQVLVDTHDKFTSAQAVKLLANAIIVIVDSQSAEEYDE